MKSGLQSMDMAFSWAESVAVQTGSPVVWCDSRTSAALRWPFDDVDMAKRWQLLSATQVVRAWALWVYSACGRGRHTQQKSGAQDIILAPTYCSLDKAVACTYHIHRDMVQERGI